MRWEFFAEPAPVPDPNMKWRPTGVLMFKKLLDDSGNELTRTAIGLQDAIANAPLTEFSSVYLSVVRAHFDLQYDLIYSSEDTLHPSMALIFGQEFSSCIGVYKTLKSGVLDE